MPTGTELSQYGVERFSALVEIGAWKMYTMNSRRMMPAGMVGFPDHIIYKRLTGVEVHVEVKGDNDSLRPEQKLHAKIMHGLCSISKRYFYILLEDESDWDLILNYEREGENFHCPMMYLL